MSTIKTPGECVQQICTIGQTKALAGPYKSFFLAIMAGAYIGFGSILAIKCAGAMPSEYWGSIQRLIFGGVFPVGLLLVVITGADLFTGNCMYMPAAVATKKTCMGGLAKSWTLSYFGNLVGSVFVALVLTSMAGILFDKYAGGVMPLANYAVSVANGKCALPFETAFIRGIGCNWLVCLAIFMAVTAPDAVSKAVVIWPPIMAFVALGFEHSVANMTFIPLGIFIGESQTYLSAPNAVALTASWSGFVGNLIPVTLGNIVGGGIVALMVKAFPLPKQS